ncbi:MAG TPA: FAD-dependent oxidoreductase [Fimbriimonadaceae bacterium]|nr:FAD-dependent oxidoreductase [Fimbriimonadaceae bacterium]
MNVAVIGAGVSGLAAARTLTDLGLKPKVFESDDEVGGRIRTVHLGGFLFDAGATTIAPRGRDLEEVMFRRVSGEGLVKIERPVFVHNSLRVSAGDPAKNRIDRYCYVGGNQTLCDRLAANLDVRNGAKIESIERANHGFALNGESFDGLVLALPIPEAKKLLDSAGESRPFSNSRYRSCLSVLLGYGFPDPDIGYHALVDPDGTHPLGWLSFESLKCAGRAPEGKCAVVAQLGPQFSKLYFEATDEYIVEATLGMLSRLYHRGWLEPEVSAVVRWETSQPEMTAQFDSVNRPGSRLVVAGDGLIGPRVEYAYECGVKAARLLAEAK